MKHFEELTMTDALQYISRKEYNKIFDKQATHETKFKLYIQLVENGDIDPIQVNLPTFYK